MGVRGCHRWIQQVDCRRAISESDGWIKLHACSLRLPPLQLAELIFKLLVFAPALGAVYQVNFKNVGVHLPPVQSNGLIVRFLVFAPATHAVPDRESGFAFIATSLSPCHLCRRVSLNPRRHDPIRYITSGFADVFLP